MSKRVRVIVNPAARTLPSRDRLETAPAWLRLHEWQVDVRWTDAPRDAESLARSAADDGFDAVVAVGGDGTVNEVANGLAGSRTALAVIPAGTANVWAHEIGGPRHPGSVAAMVDGGHRRRVDLGMAGARYFLLMASLGLDSAVAAMLNATAKARFGRAAYIGRGIREMARYRGIQATITADGQTWRLPLLIALLGNTRSYGGLISISHRARADDGVLDLVMYRAGGVAGFTGHVLRTLLRTHAADDGTVYRQVREVRVETDPVVPVQVDGEVIGTTPMSFRVVPAALDVIVPHNARLRMLTP